MNKQSSYQKLKAKIVEQEMAYKKLRDDFKKYHSGDFTIQTQYGMQFNMEDAHEAQLWLGEPTKNG